MFTGIVAANGKITSVTPLGAGVDAGFTIRRDESISIFLAASPSMRWDMRIRGWCA